MPLLPPARRDCAACRPFPSARERSCHAGNHTHAPAGSVLHLTSSGKICGRGVVIYLDSGQNSGTAFCGFFNGSTKAPEDITLKLSDAFAERKGKPQKKKEPELELKVRFLNINQGHNGELMKRCRTLREYSEFVARVRKYADAEETIEKAVDRAVTECIAEGILADFLRDQRKEVIAVSIFEYNEEEELKKFGKAEYRSGKAEGKGESVILALEMKGSVPEVLKERIFEEKDVSLLEAWLRAAIEADTAEAFLEKTGLQRNVL